MWPWLPGELWTFVFRHLPLLDRLRVRSTCKFFSDLVDGALLRDWTVVLKKSYDEYEEDFWRMLRRWRVTSANLTSRDSWTHIAKELPGLTTLRIELELFTPDGMQDLRGFINLEHLNLIPPLITRLGELSLFLPQQLTHLMVCQICGHCTLPTEIPDDSPFKQLKSFIFHFNFDPHPVNVLHFFLSSLPQLEHLSMTFNTDVPFEGQISDLSLLRNCPLSSLELLRCCSKTLPLDLMKMLSVLPFLRSLSIFNSYDEEDNEFYDASEKLSAWLEDLPALTSLLVSGIDVDGFVRSIPASVTCLTLKPPNINSQDMSALSTQLPNLHFLYLCLESLYPGYSYYDPGCLDSDIALIPQLFPRLKTVCLAQRQVSQDAFLSLASLKELEELEVLDEEPMPAALVSELRLLTNNRVQIYNRPDNRWQQACLCSIDILTEDW